MIKINKKLKERDYDFRYMDMKDKKEHEELYEDNPVSIEIKPIKIRKPTIRKNNFFAN